MSTSEKQGKAKAIADELNTRKDRWGDPIFTARVWTGGDRVRVYTGQTGEFLEIQDDGRITRSHTSMSWGQIIDEVL
jgi:hypothetical protein